MSPTTFGWLVLAFPLVGTAIIGVGYRALRPAAPWIATLTIFLSFLASIGALLELLHRHAGPTGAGREVVSTAWTYAFGGSFDAKLQILIDPISVFMMLVVTGVSTLIHLYSISYMRSDAGRSRYFAYLNFFVLSMLILVTGGNFLVLLIGWGMVGTASYLLISFWYRRRTATSAGIKAFIVNTVGDVGIVLGIFFLFRHTHTVGFLQTFAVLPHVFHKDSTDLVAASILLLVGAFAKSAQIPLHTWLADAMEGPTPVSSLIHAATMVTAGVYLIVRIHPLLELAPTAADVGAAVGCVTLLVAGTIGLVQVDIKRIIAYSTMSQIGYMIMGAASGAYSGALFHLMTHAFFKALLFMAAGSIIGAMAGSQSLDRMSGFRKALPFTFMCFIVGGLALCGFPPFSGWLSKDDILGYLLQRGGWFAVMGIAGYVGALLTGFYTFRLIFRAFFGDPCPEAVELAGGHLAHAHVPTNPTDGEEEDTDIGFPGPEHVIAEREWPMKIAMGLLALGALVGGFLQIPGVDHVVDTFLASSFHGSTLYAQGPSTSRAWTGLIVGAIVAVVAIASSYVIWIVRPGTAPALERRLPWLHTFLFNKWYFDELNDVLIVRPALMLGRFAASGLERVVVGDGITGTTVGVVRAVSGIVRRAQTGILRYYSAVMALGVAVVVLYFLVRSS